MVRATSYRTGLTDVFSWGALCHVHCGLKIEPVSRPSSNGRIVFLFGVDSFLMMFVGWSYLRVGILPRVFVLAAVVLGYSRPRVDGAVAAPHPCQASGEAERETGMERRALRPEESLS